jgi:sulfur-oxidizing protein SoxY
MMAGAIMVPMEAFAEPDPWPALADQMFPNRPIADGAAFLSIDAPYRAEDAAIVPVSFQTTLAPDDHRKVQKLTLIVEANPSPLAGCFTLGAEAGVTRVGTRIRVDGYTNVRVVAELSDGMLYTAARFVKAAGGCSAPALKQNVDAIPLGTLRFRAFAVAESGRREAQLMIRHPNYSGMQMDQVSRLYIPAEFVEELTIWQAERPLLSVQGGISISENPMVRFDFRAGSADRFRIAGTDNTGRRFQGQFTGAGEHL